MEVLRAHRPRGGSRSRSSRRSWPRLGLRQVCRSSRSSAGWRRPPGGRAPGASGSRWRSADERARTPAAAVAEIGIVFQALPLRSRHEPRSENVALPLVLAGEKRGGGGGGCDASRGRPRPSPDAPAERAVRRRAAARRGGARLRRRPANWSWPTSPPAISTRRTGDIVAQVMFSLTRCETARGSCSSPNDEALARRCDRVIAIDAGGALADPQAVAP